MRASSTPRPFGSITDVSGVLVHPPEPVIRPAKSRTGWRIMTNIAYGGQSVRRSSTCPPKLEERRRKSEGGSVPTILDEAADRWWARRKRLYPPYGVSVRSNRTSGRNTPRKQSIQY